MIEILLHCSSLTLLLLWVNAFCYDRKVYVSKVYCSDPVN